VQGANRSCFHGVMNKLSIVIFSRLNAPNTVEVVRRSYLARFNKLNVNTLSASEFYQTSFSMALILKKK